MLEVRDITFIIIANAISILIAVFAFRIRLENRITKLETLINVMAQKFGISLIED